MRSNNGTNEYRIRAVGTKNYEDDFAWLTHLFVEVSKTNLRARLGILDELLSVESDPVHDKFLRLSIVQNLKDSSVDLWLDEVTMSKGTYRFRENPPDGYKVLIHAWKGALRSGSSEIEEHVDGSED
ncbi:MAG: hypothetical protein MJA83_00480 [Gammaproteobacteria bacterium]|nr:hypothetical protein [Gammaproteobacteria bacterium]